MFSVSGRIQDLSVGVENAWTQRHFSAKVDNIGNESFVHHQRGLQKDGQSLATGQTFFTKHSKRGHVMLQHQHQKLVCISQVLIANSANVRNINKKIINTF